MMDEQPQPTDESVTWIITHQVRPDRIEEWEEWIKGITAVAAGYPGYQGLTVIRPKAGDNEYVNVVRFATYEDLRRLEQSPERAEWLRKLEPLVSQAPVYQTETGLEGFFMSPGQEAIVPPPKYKMAVLVLAAIYPLILIVVPILGWIFPGQAYVAVPITIGPEFFVRTLVTAVILVILMTWVAMPQLTRWARPWLR